MNKNRLDAEMAKRKITETRSKAQLLIRGGLIKVNGKTAAKTGLPVSETDEITVEASESSPVSFVSRAGLKLQHALKFFGVTVSGIKCLDAGASTGGFTDCLLRSGAEKVYSVDIGKNQLHPSLKSNKKIVSLEETDIRNYAPRFKFGFACADLSFISLTKVLPGLSKSLKSGSSCVVLIKPQFEAGKGMVNKKGIVTKESVIKSSVDRVLECARESGFTVSGISESPVKGKEGNREFTAHLIKREK